MNLSEYTIEQLVELKNEVENRIYGYKDGYFYICNVRFMVEIGKKIL